jgi:hypothetical protein
MKKFIWTPIEPNQKLKYFEMPSSNIKYRPFLNEVANWRNPENRAQSFYYHGIL